MDGNNAKKDDENGQLSYGIYSSAAAARLLLQRLGWRSLPRSLDIMMKISIDLLKSQLIKCIRIEIYSFVN